jgi:heme oxygenase
MLSQRIKEETREAHQQLEILVVKEIKAIGAKQDYAALLDKFYTYFSRVEQQISPFITSEVLPDYSERRNSTYLKRDMEALGYTVKERGEVDVPLITSSITALGALYVLEGSIMGGSIIVQMLSKLGISDGISFFSGYGKDTGAMWQRFTNALNQHAATPDDEAEAINTANETFIQFKKMFISTPVA